MVPTSSPIRIQIPYILMKLKSIGLINGRAVIILLKNIHMSLSVSRKFMFIRPLAKLNEQLAKNVDCDLFH